MRLPGESVRILTWKVYTVQLKDGRSRNGRLLLCVLSPRQDKTAYIYANIFIGMKGKTLNLNLKWELKINISSPW